MINDNANKFCHAWLPGQGISNIALGAWLAFDCVYLSVGVINESFDIGAAILAMSFAYLALATMTRGEAQESSKHPGIILISILGSVVPLAYVVTQESDHGIGWLWGWHTIFSVFILASSIAIGGNFSLIPECRSIVRHGPYRFVRHPLYASYLCYDIIFVLSAGTSLSVFIWVSEAVLLVLRSLQEERMLLAHSQEYQAYCRTVTSRFIPGVI